MLSSGVLTCAALAEEENAPVAAPIITAQAALPFATITEAQNATGEAAAAIQRDQGKEIEGAPEGARCKYLVTVANDFIVAAYKNGELIAPGKRHLLLDRFGATSERINVSVKAGDWLVFHVVHNPVRWGGSKYFAVAGCLGPNQLGFVSDPASPAWSVCDDPGKAAEFIRGREVGVEARALPIATPWSEGDGLIRRYAGESFKGKALWGTAPSTWIKFVSPAPSPKPGDEELAVKDKSAPEAPKLLEAKRWPVQILSAIYGTGGKNADVTAKVKEYVELQRKRFASNPVELGADPNPFWNKGLHIIYMKDSVRREQHRNENEHVLPESFYGPQDAGELKRWLPESRWSGAEGKEMQFHEDGTFTMSGSESAHRWEALGPKKLRLTWAAETGQQPVEFVFDHTWSSFSEVQNARNGFHLLR